VQTNTFPVPHESWNQLPPVRFSWSNTGLVGTITGISPEGVCTVIYDAIAGFSGGVQEVPLSRIINLNPTIDRSAFQAPQAADQRIASGSRGVSQKIKEQMK
jgi:hypothetical protein